MRTLLRTVTEFDVDSVAALMREAGFKARNREGWRWLFEDNPARRDRSEPMGWVLDRDGALVGYLGNIPLDYAIDGRDVRAATCTSYYVRPDARGESMHLMSAFFRQPEVELFLSTTANPASAPVYRLFKAAAPSDSSFLEEYAWVGDDAAALRGALARRRLSGFAANAVVRALAPPARLVRRAIGFAEPAASAIPVRRIEARDIDERFDALWARLKGMPGIRVRRDATALRWYLSDPEAPRAPVLFVAERESEVIGYALASHHWPPGNAEEEIEILDLVAAPGAEDVIGALVRAVVDYARETRTGLVYCRRSGESLARELRGLRPHVARRSEAEHFIRATDRAGTDRVAAAGVWHATGLDGDSPFCMEYPNVDSR